MTADNGWAQCHQHGAAAALNAVCVLARGRDLSLMIVWIVCRGDSPPSHLRPPFKGI